MAQLESTEVVVKRTISVGGHYRINGSWAYAGIDNDVVEVIAITTYNETTQDAKDFVEVELQDLEDDESEVLSEEFTNSLWVRYRYRNGETWWLPIDMFANHISQC